VVIDTVADHHPTTRPPNLPPQPSAFADALVLTGATGSGKSAVALELAERIGAEIVGMDSMTLYRGLDVGTAKPTAGERDRVRHHLIDVLDPWESASVAWWLDRAAGACADIRSRGKRPLFVGGTPFYLKALLYGLFEAPPADPEVRRRLEAEAGQLGRQALHDRLRAVDPRTAGRLHPNDVRRVVRALEVWQLTGKPISSFQQTWDTAAFAGEQARPAVSVPCVVLEWPRAELYQRIEARVDAMLAAGWLDEVRRLRALPRPLGREASQALGYRELLAHLDGTGPGWAETVALIKTRTRQFAKRQLTWFRHLSGCRPCPADRPGTADRVFDLYESLRPDCPAEET
jgi:tRNA dimethylallyltransferase